LLSMLWWLAQNTLAAGVLAGLAAVVCRFVRLGPAAQHALWLVVLIKLVTPPLPLWPWPLPGVGELSHESILAPAGGSADKGSFPWPLASQAGEEAEDSWPREAASLPPLGFPDLDQDTRLSKRSAATASPQAEWLVLLQSIWLAGVAVLCVLHSVRIARFRRLLGHTEPAPRWLEELVARIAGTMGVRPPQTLLMQITGSPSIWGLGRPKLLWPACLLERLPPASQHSIVTHELAHLRRRDHWVGWLQLVAECIWWWNPLFWYVRRQLRFQAELACDAWVVASLPEDRRAYAEALIEITQLVSREAAPLPALGMGSAARHDFERRLTMIMCDQVPCRVPLVGLVAIGVLALVSLPGWSQSGVKVEAVPDPQQAPTPEMGIIVSVPVETTARIIKVFRDSDDGALVEAQPGSGSEREHRIERLEQRLEELLREVQALRAGGTKPQTIKKTVPTDQPGEPADRPRIQIGNGSEGKRLPASGAQDKGQPAMKSGAIYDYYPQKPQFGVIGKKTESGMALSRVVYQLPRVRAEALAKLLSEHSKVEVLETRVEGDNLIVTTTPEVQEAIRHFLSLLGTTSKMGVQGVSVSPDGKSIITWSRDGSKIHWDAKSGKELRWQVKPDPSGKAGGAIKGY
jgi:beta-lactamase regulating signal transducer with metallopeptidase domain